MRRMIESCRTTDSATSGTTLQYRNLDIQSVRDRMEEIVAITTIYIWKNKPEDRYNPFSDDVRPELKCSKLIDDPYSAFIVAGIGIVAGEKAFEVLSKLNLNLVWSDEYIPLEDQQSYALIKDWLKPIEEKKDEPEI